MGARTADCVSPAPRGARLAIAAVLLAVAVSSAGAEPPARKPVVSVSGGSFARRHEQYVALVENGSAQALTQLQLAYRRRDLEAAERACIVSLACDGFVDADMTEPFAAWRDKDHAEADVWLWYRTLRREIGKAGPARAYAAARDEARPAVIRAAALRALAAWADEGIPAFVASPSARFVGDPSEKDVWVAALADAVASQPGRVGSRVMRDATTALLPFLHKDATSPRARLDVARALQRLLGTPALSFDASYYEARLDRLESPARPEDDRYATPPFFGVEGTGDRVVYVLDLSGSMNDSLTDEEKVDLRKVAADPGARGATGAVPAIPLDKIRSRLDAAVEFTKASVRGLEASASFAIVFFSSTVGWANGQAELRPATPANVADALKALDRTRMSQGTNLHGGLRRAFEALMPVPGRRSRFSGSTGDPDEISRAPTTIFLLSDGDPNTDDWGFSDRVPTGPARATPPPAATPPPTSTGASDPEPTAPFEETESLVDDIARMNLLRGCEIHAIGIGEFRPRLLDRLAHAGRGSVRRIGGARDSTADGASGAAAKSAVPTARELVAMFRRLKMSVPAYLLRLAAEEEKKEREAKKAGAKDAEPTAPPAPPPPEATTPEEDLKVLETDPSPDARCAAAERLARRGEGTAIPALARVRCDDRDPSVESACDAALRRLAGRGFGDGMTGLPECERVALRRNWEWWWSLHHEEIEKATAARKAAAAPTGGASPPGPTPAIPEGTPPK